jgi:RarD protein
MKEGMKSNPAGKNHSSSYHHIWKPLLAVVVWGFSFIATKQLLGEIKPLVIILLRQIIACVFLTALALKTGKKFTIGKSDLAGILILSLIATIHLSIQITGLQYTTASNTGWIIGITPVFMALLGMIFFKEKISRIQTAGILVSFLGLILLVSRGNLASIGLISNKGDFLILASSFTWAVYSLVGKRVTLKFSPMMTILFLFAFMSLFVSPFALTGDNIDAVCRLSLTSLFSILFLGLFCSGIAYVLWAQSMSELPASKVGAFLYIEPFVTFFGAWMLLNEHVTLLTMMSGLVIIGGVLLVNRK